MSAEPIPAEETEEEATPEPGPRTPVLAPYLEKDEKGIVRIQNSRIKVKHLAGYYRYYGYSVEYLHDQFPHLPKAAIYSAMAYYFANQWEIDAEMDASAKYAEEMMEKLDSPDLKAKIRARWEEMKAQRA
jgi:uncharacterized protein (DUF433 family)